MKIQQRHHAASIVKAHCSQRRGQSGTVNAFDFGQMRNAFGSSTGQAAYRDWLDINGDGSINAFDFGQVRSRFGLNLFP